jgi:hypothetical protein
MEENTFIRLFPQRQSTHSNDALPLWDAQTNLPGETRA